METTAVREAERPWDTAVPDGITELLDVVGEWLGDAAADMPNVQWERPARTSIRMGAPYQSTTIREVQLDGRDWEREVLSRLEQVAELPNNWDHEGSPRTSPAILVAAWDFITRLELDDFPVPFVCPVPGGGFQFEWSAGTKHVEIEFVDEKTILYLTQEQLPQGDRIDSGEYPFNDTDKTRRLLNWFTRSG